MTKKELLKSYEIGEEQYNDLVEENNKLNEKIIELQLENEKQKEILEAFKRRLVEKANGEVIISEYSGALEDYEDVKKDLKIINDWWVKN